MKKPVPVNGSKIILGKTSNFSERYIPEYTRLKNFAEHCKGLGLRVVLTQGTYDMAHIGHARYFEMAKRYGDILIVGVDSDRKVRKRKGPERPVIPETERLEMVTHMRPVDVVTIKEPDMPKWHLIKTVCPDVLVATKETYTREELQQLKKYCGRVVVLKPMATTSTSAKIRLMQIKTAKKIGQTITPKLIQVLKEALDGVR